MLQPGMKIRDNDPRVGLRILTVDRIDGDRVQCSDKHRSVIVNAKRIHTDGKPRRSGFSLVEPRAVVAPKDKDGWCPGEITLTLDHQEAQAILNGLYEGGALKGPLYFDHVLRLKSKVETAMTAAGFPPIKR